MSNFFDILFGFGSKKLELGGPAGESMEEVWLSVNENDDEVPISYEEFYKQNTSEGVEPLDQSDFDKIKKLRVGEGLHFGQSSYVERVLPPMGELQGKEREVAEQQHKVSTNDYAGLTPAEVWDAWTPKQRFHFIADHYRYIHDLHEKDHKNSGLNFENWHDNLYIELPQVIKTVFDEHISDGQYGFGGNIKSFASKIHAKGKELYHQGKEATEKAIHDKKEDIALNVINEAREKIIGNKRFEKLSKAEKGKYRDLQRAEDLVIEHYGLGGNIKKGFHKAKAAAKTVLSGVSDKELAQMEKEAATYKGGGPVPKALKVEKGEHADFWHVRFRTPGQFKKFATPPWAEKVAGSVHEGAKAVMGKKDGKWHMQQILIPDTVAKGKVKKIAEQVACKLSYECRKKNKK